MDRPRPLYDTVGDDEVSVAHKLDVGAAPPLSVDILPIPLMRCLDMHMSAVNNSNSIGHFPEKKKTCAWFLAIWSSFESNTNFHTF